MRSRLLVLLLLVSAFALPAQTVDWVKKNGPLGGEVLDIEVDVNTGKIFLLDADSRPYVSGDNGATWQRLTFTGSDNSNFRDIEITNNTIFLVGGYDLYASADGGVTFQIRMTTSSPYQDVYRIKRMPASGNLIALAFNAIYSSTNDGQTWTLTGLLSQADSRFLEINAVDQIFILKQNGSNVLRPFRSADGGATFTEQSSGILAGKEAMGLFGENNGGNVYCLTNTDLYSSSNGNTWTNIKTGSLTDEFITDYTTFGRPSLSYVEFSADGLGMFFVDNLNHKLHSKALAASDWELQSDVFPSGTLTALCASAVNYPNATSAIAFFGTESGVYKTTTGGASVTENNTGLASVRAEQIISDNSSNLYIKTNSVGLLKSQDEGNTWAKITGLPNTLDFPLEYFFQTPEGDILFAHADINLYRSFNRGSSWSPLANPVGGFQWADAAGDGKLFGIQGNYPPASFYYSADEGTLWNPVAVTGLPADFYINETEIALASQQYMLVYLYNYDDDEYQYYSITFTYDDITGAVTTATANKITTLPFEANNITKTIGANGNFYLYDRYSGDPEEVAISADGGVTWVTRTLPQSTDLFVADNGYIFCADGNSGKVYISRDDGVSFIETSLPSAVDVDDLSDITIDNSGYAYLAFDGDYVYQTTHTIVLPSPLTGLQVIGHTSQAVALRWVDQNNYDRDITIERSINGTDFEMVGQVDGWDLCYSTEARGYFVDDSAQPETTYTYRVTARNEAGSSAPSSTTSVSTLSECAPALPENRSWSAINSGIEGYALLPEAVDVGIKHLGGGKYELSDLSLGLTGSAEKSVFYVSCDKTLVGTIGDIVPNGQGDWNGTTLTLKWRACNDDDKTETISLTLNATDPAPEKPAVLLGYVSTNSAIDLSWRSGYYEASYVLERSLSAAFTDFEVIATPAYPETRFIDDTGLIQGTTYHYRLKSLNGNVTPETSPYSDVLSIPFNKPNFLVADNAITDFQSSVTLSSIWADFNNDGLEDYFTMQFDETVQRGVPVIFRNLGGGVFEAINIDVGESSYFWPSVADFDNDQFPDIALGGDNTRLFDLFKGNGDFTFVKVPSGQLGDLGAISHELSSTSWADINNDGLLDLLIINQEVGGFSLYKQNSNHSFTKVFEGQPTNDEPLLSVWADYDNDGFQDVLLGNLDGSGGLYRNNGDETFSLTTGNGLDAANFFAASWGDFNNDGNMDLFVANSAENALYKNNGDGTFTKDVSTSISEPNLAISASWGDFNNDGYLDLITAGFASTQTRLFMRDPGAPALSFDKVITEKINDLSISHYSVANADLDQDGLLDVAFSNFSFDDENGDALRPTNNNLFKSNHLPGNWSLIRLVPVTGNSEAIGARISLTAGGKTQTREIATTSSVVSRNSRIAHFGLGASSVITNIQVRWPNGSVQNYPLPPSNEVLVIDEDVTGPAIISRTPAHNATDVATNTTITLEFNENNLPLATKKLTITKAGETTPAASIDVTNAVKTGNEYVFTLTTALEPETEYNITLDAGAFRDRWINPSQPVGPGEWTFTTRAEADAEPPVITFTVPDSPAKGFGTVTPSLSVTDNQVVESVVVSIRPITGKNFVEFAASPGAGANYVVTLSESAHFDAIGAEFFITATDASGNNSRHPADVNSTHKVFLNYSAENASIPTSSLGLGGQKAGWKIFAIPFEIPAPNNGVTAIFEELAGRDSKEDYRLITYGTPTKWSEYPADFSALSRGQGYFINIREDPGAIDLFALQAPANSRSSLFEIDLKSGWNMIGNPYLTPISWDDVAALNGLVLTEAQLKTYSGGNYVNDQALGPYEGGLVFVEAAKTISIPFLGQTSEGGRRGIPTLGDDISAESWALPLTVSLDGLTYTLGGIGMAPDANLTIDNFDDITPPRLIDYIEINFSHPEHAAKRFTREIVPTQQNHTWDFTVDSNLKGIAALAWKNLPLMSSAKEIFLLDVGAQKLVNMKETETHHFDPGESKHFRIYYGDNLNIAPERVQLGKAYPNPTQGLTNIAFSLPETGGLNQSVSLEIIDPLGRTIGTVKHGRFNPGYHEATFNALDITSGLYTYRLTVKNMKGQTTEVNKLIIK